MRLLINCPSGESRLLQVPDDATVQELKQILFEEEGIPVDQQVLCFAGQQLKNHLTLADHNMQAYTLSNEVVLYLSKALANPKRILLSARHKLFQQVAELVEADMPVGQVMGLLESRAMAATFASGTAIYAKRQDGSTVPLKVDPAWALSTLEEKIGLAEGLTPTALTFLQAQDGNLHVILYPSGTSSTQTYPVYTRNTRPQQAIIRKDAATGQPLPELVKELCVLP